MSNLTQNQNQDRNQNQWNDELNQEVSSIKPDLGTLGQKEKQIPRFTYSTAEYDSYIKNGFGAPALIDRSDKFEVRFLQQVDLSKCKNNKIQIRILNMQRTRAISYENEKEEKREYLVYLCDWLANNWLGNQIAVRSHIEGKHQELTRRLVTKMDNDSGRINAYYVRGNSRTVHTIPFSKKKIEDILYSKHPFGEDSINITDPESVIFYARLDGERGISNMRTDGYTLEQFLTPEWKHFLELALKRGGPSGRLTNAEAENYIK